MRPVLTIALCTTVLLGLAACAPDDHVLSPTAPPLEGEGTLPPEPSNEVVGINCATLISDQVIYDWGSGNFAFDTSFVPKAGSSAAQIAADGGLTCRWINLTSQETVDAAVMIPAEDDLDAAERAAAAAGTAAPEFGDAYFHAIADVGYVDVFGDGYWLTLESTWFLEPGDASALVTAAVAALPPVG